MIVSSETVSPGGARPADPFPRVPMRDLLSQCWAQTRLTSRYRSPFPIRSYPSPSDRVSLPPAALIAAMRKLLTILNAMLKKNETWNPKIA